MDFNNAMLLSSYMYLLLISGFFFFRKRIINYETKAYSYLLASAFILIIFEFSCVLSARFDQTGSTLFAAFVGRGIMVAIILWITIFTYYIILVTRKTKNIERDRKFKNMFLIIFIINSLMVCALPLYFYTDGKIAYTYGPSTNYVVGVIFAAIIINIYCAIKSRKYLKRKKIIPIFAFITSIIILIMVRSISPDIQMFSAIFTFVTILMYFTIENPDVKMIEQLNILKEQADRANRAKSDFLSSMSHEIRTPLNAIVGFSNTLNENKNLPPELKDEVKDILTASDNLLEIVNGVLDISKIEANKIEIIKKEYDTKKMFDELCKLTKVRIGEKPIEFISKIDEDLPRVLYGDSTRVKQIILNLLTNAAKYTDEGKIELDVKSVKKDNIVRLIVSVKDTGRGIKQESIDKLFTKFERLDEEGNTTIEGTGLGLAITKKLLELMHGTIVVDSTYGKGSKFTVSIDQGYVEKPTLKFEDTNMIISSLDLSGKKILLVDDNKLNIKVAEKLLEPYKAEITSLLSGEETLELLKKDNKFDLILLDDMMPKMSGTETFNKIKEDDLYSGPIVVLTANALTGEKEKYLEIGFDDYLAKPIEKIELNRVLKKYLKK